MAGSDGRVLLGQITGAIGVRGELKVHPYTATPEAVGAYGPVTVEPGGRTLTLTVLRPVKGGIAVRAEGIADRNQAEALKGARLYVPRAALPPAAEGEYYYADLIGLRAEDGQGADLGVVQAVHDYGGGTLLEYGRPGEKTQMVTFTDATVPVVDIEGGRVVILPPEVIEGEAQP
jgi:16S rRNA processing protein RimM